MSDSLYLHPDPTFAWYTVTTDNFYISFYCWCHVFLCYSSQTGNYQSNWAIDWVYQQWRLWGICVSFFLHLYGNVELKMDLLASFADASFLSFVVTGKFVILVWLPLSLRLWVTWWKDMTSIAFILRMVSWKNSSCDLWNSNFVTKPPGQLPVAWNGNLLRNRATDKGCDLIIYLSLMVSRCADIFEWFFLLVCFHWYCDFDHMWETSLPAS